MKCPLWYQFTPTEEQGHTLGRMSLLEDICEQKMKSNSTKYHLTLCKVYFVPH